LLLLLYDDKISHINIIPYIHDSWHLIDWGQLYNLHTFKKNKDPIERILNPKQKTSIKAYNATIMV
jgi:hypothetical protein